MWQFCPSTRLDGSQAPVTQSWVEASDLLHRKVDYPWTIADLASQVGLSRSALAERFIRYLSEPPMIYLTRWRLQLAAHSLVHTSKGVVEIASDVGYESESAFNRAFKREFALPPAQYRREQRNVSPTKLPIL
ncbi:MAG: helix-turn-helix transcriptional regulator [Bryobacteraceae bacterium]